LRDKLDARINQLVRIAESDLECGRINGLSDALYEIDTELLEIEEQQHLDTGTNCIEKYIKGDLILGENIAKQYFNQTFKTK
jgi:hypothetical protein